MNTHDKLIARLSRDLAPVSPVPNVNALSATWLSLSAIYVVLMTHLVGPIRPGAYSQLFTEPRFLLESLLGAAAITWVGMAAFRAAIPAVLSKTFATAGVVLLSLWLGQYVFGLIDPALEPSMLGKRGHCYLETMAYSLPPIAIAVVLIRRLYPLKFIRTAMVLGLAAGMLPALYMQLACMYEPVHILGLHILPGLAMVLVGAAIAALWPLRRNGSDKR
jgi:hypothetical protein